MSPVNRWTAGVPADLRKMHNTIPSHPSVQEFLAPNIRGRANRIQLFGRSAGRIPRPWPCCAWRTGECWEIPHAEFVTHLPADGALPGQTHRSSDRHTQPKSVIDYLKLFYNDTAYRQHRHLMCAYAFFGRHTFFSAPIFPRHQIY